MITEQLPIYTEAAECRDCYKCVRNCDVKAIEVDNHEAVVVNECCIYCGKCVNTCPVSAKKVRDDVFKAKQLLQDEGRTIISLAPSWVSEFVGVTSEQMIAALEVVGAYGVSETALAADYLNDYLNENLSEQLEGMGGVQISSACPVVVSLVQKYYPQLSPNLTQCGSPMVIHGRLLKQLYGEDARVIFIGPCIAKKHEADQNAIEIDVAIGFDELRSIFNDMEVIPSDLSVSNKFFIPESSSKGALYPLDGGMLSGLKDKSISYFNYSGMEEVKGALDNVSKLPANSMVFLELLSCAGGCINGPLQSESNNCISKNLSINSYEKNEQQALDLSVPCELVLESDPVVKEIYSENEIVKALRSIGKRRREDELNCGGCGYDNCRDMVCAIMSGFAQPEMCVSYMRRLAQKKANALIKSIPFGVVIVDSQLKILESNQSFAKLIGDDFVTIYESLGSLESICIDKIEPFNKLISGALYNDEEINKDIRFQDMILSASIFPIEKKQIAGMLVQDITNPVVQREQIIKKAHDVLVNNNTTVQKIAYLLGENAADSEILLSSIIDSFGAKDA